jgi:hypothetical protein
MTTIAIATTIPIPIAYINKIINEANTVEKMTAQNS